MSDWQVGDLAVCVDDNPCHCGCHITALRNGMVLSVSAVLRGPEGIGLRFKEVDHGVARGGGTDSSPRIHTPIEFRDLLLSIARTAQPRSLAA